MVGGGGEVMAHVALHDEMFTAHEDLLAPDVIEDPYTYFGRLREEDPVHWNPLYDTWVITRYDDVVWSLRHPEFFSHSLGFSGRQMASNGEDNLILDFLLIHDVRSQD
jgi:cytochrome P450